MGAPSSRQRLSPEKRRAQLLACALRVFARRGLGRAAHAEVAREGGVSVSTAFVYFPSRKALVEAVLGEVDRFYTAMADAYHDGRRRAPEAVIGHAVAFARSVDTHTDYARVWLDWSTAIRDDVWPAYLEFEDGIVRRMERSIRRGRQAGILPRSVAPHETALLIVGSARMIAQMKFTGAPDTRLQRFMLHSVSSALGTPVTLAMAEPPAANDPAASETADAVSREA